MSSNLQLKWNSTNIKYKNTYQQNNSCTITDVLLLYIETLRRLGNRNHMNENTLNTANVSYRSSHSEVFLGKGDLKMCSKYTGEHPCRSVISIKLLCNFIEITLRHGCSPVNLPHVFRTPFLKNTSGWLLL